LPDPLLAQLSWEANFVPIVTGRFPDLRIDFPAYAPVGCLPILADDDNPILADDDNALLASCECLVILADDDNPILADDDNALLADCP